MNSLLDDNQDAVIIDPYMGSGSTAIAARLLKHNFIGIDISQEYINMANKRLNNLDIYSDLLNEEKQKHSVRKTFKERKESGGFTGKFRKGLSIINTPISLFD